MKRFAFALFFTAACGAVVAATGFGLSEDGVETPRGRIAWDELVRLRVYNRPALRSAEYAVEARLLSFSGSRAEIACTDPETRTFVPVKVAVDDDYLRIRIDAGDVVEPHGGLERLMEIVVAPRLLRTGPGSKGAYLLPLYGGALGGFDRRVKAKTRDRIYVEQPVWEKMGMINAFGAAFAGEGSLLGVVHSGDFRAWVETSSDGTGSMEQQAVLGYREDHADIPEFETKEVLFRWIPGEGRWEGMALAFGEYLRNERRIPTLAEKARARPELRKALTAVRINIFHGMKKPFRPDGSGKYCSCTTFAEAEEIVERAHALGIANAWVCLVGWIPGGHDGGYPSHFPVNPEAGGEEGLRKLIERIHSYGWTVTPHDNIHSLYRSSPDFDASVACITRGGEPRPMGLWAGGMTLFACPHLYFPRYSGDYERMKELGFGGVFYIDALMSGFWRCHSPDHPANERELEIGQLRILGWARANFGASATEFPAVPALDYIDFAANGTCGNRVYFRNRMPAETQLLRDRFVPFWNVGVHGIIAYTSSFVPNFMLRGKRSIAPLYVEASMPGCEVSYRPGGNGTPWKESLDVLLEPYRVCYEIAPGLGNGVATGFEEYAEDAVHWTFDNGYEIFSNAGDATVAGLAPGSVRVLKDGKEVYSK